MKEFKETLENIKMATDVKQRSNINDQAEERKTETTKDVVYQGGERDMKPVRAVRRQNDAPADERILNIKSDYPARNILPVNNNGFPNQERNHNQGEPHLDLRLDNKGRSNMGAEDSLQAVPQAINTPKPMVDNHVNHPNTDMSHSVVNEKESSKSLNLNSGFASGNDSLMKYTENVDIGSGHYKAYWVNGKGPLLKRVSQYNAAIHKLRQQLVKERADKPWQPLSGAMESLWCNLDDFHKELEKYPIVKTISLAWNSNDLANGRIADWNSSIPSENLLLNTYYSWSASDSLCRWVHTAGFTRARWDAVYNRTCHTLKELPASYGKQQLEPVYLHGKPINKKHYWPHYGTSYPKYFYTTPPPQVFYMHIMEDAVVTSLGDVISRNFKLVPYSCSQDIEASPPPSYQFSPLYDEVFVMGQYWGANFFHMMVENLPRIAPYLEFLKMNPGILIHAQATDSYTARTIRMLGLNSTRLIKGTVRARRVYLSQATPCGFPHLQSLQILSYYYQNYIHTLPEHPKHNRQSLLLIRRSGSRRFTQHLRIREELEKVAMEFDLDFEMFYDNPSPPVETAMVMFHTAALVVGPHGAGLSNLVYCQPGTLVIEGVCNPPHVNMCYQWTAHVLGLRYHGIGSRGGCETWVEVDAMQLATAARELLRNKFKKHSQK